MDFIAVDPNGEAVVVKTRRGWISDLTQKLLGTSQSFILSQRNKFSSLTRSQPWQRSKGRFLKEREVRGKDVEWRDIVAASYRGEINRHQYSQPVNTSPTSHTCRHQQLKLRHPCPVFFFFFFLLQKRLNQFATPHPAPGPECS